MFFDVVPLGAPFMDRGKVPQCPGTATKFTAGFQKNFASIAAELMPEHAKGKPLEVWFQDEARVGQQGTLTRKWARRGTRPRAPHDTRYKWSYIFGAACPARGTAAGLIVPYVNAEAMGLHLNEIAKAVAHGAHAMLIVDGAGTGQNACKYQTILRS